MNLSSGLDRVRLVSNILMLTLLAGNIFFSIQYVENVKQQQAREEAEQVKGAQRLQTARFMKYFIDTVLNTKGPISFEDRVKLENDVRQLHDANITKEWETFLNSKDAKAAQESVVRLMSMLASGVL